MNKTTITEKELTEMKSKLPDWQIVEQNGVQQLKRSYKFNDFAQALDFTNQIGALAEEENHHPQLVTKWGEVSITWWTHEAGGIQPKDFELAHKADRQYESGK